MTPLFSVLRDEIAAKGPLTVERYMELVLHHPAHGYYSHRDPLGAQGDFITAPEISQMFGELIGLWSVEIWQQMGKPDPFVFLELGPGRGTLLQDVLRVTAKIDGFQSAMRLHLMECNTALRAMQNEKLAVHAPVFIQDAGQIPALPVMVIANEFFDTLPLRQFIRTETGWRERLVAVQDDSLTFVEGNVQPNLLETIIDVTQNTLGHLAPNVIRDPRLHAGDAMAGLVYEVSPPSLALMQQLTAHIVQHGGAGLFVDYGYAAPPGTDTLQAVKKHAFSNVLDDPGEADVTADVDFMALRAIAAHGGARVLGPVGQGEFLGALGIELRAAQLRQHAGEDQTASIEADLKRLVDPDQMGTQFKVLAVLSPVLKEAPGF